MTPAEIAPLTHNKRNKRNKALRSSGKGRNKQIWSFKKARFKGQESVIKPIGELARIIEQTSPADMLRFLVALERKT